MGYLPSSLGSKAAHFVSDLTTVILNPVSERETSHLPEVDEEQESSENDKDSEHNSDIQDGPDTSSFRAFLISFLSSSGSSNNDSMEIHLEQNVEMGYPTLTPVARETRGGQGSLVEGSIPLEKSLIKRLGLVVSDKLLQSLKLTRRLLIIQNQLHLYWCLRNQRKLRPPELCPLCRNHLFYCQK